MSERSRRKIRTGYVVSDKMDSTRVVAVKTTFMHSMYKKILKRTKRYMVDDPKNETRTGDKVKITETRPLSKNKHWRIIEVMEKAK